MQSLEDQPVQKKPIKKKTIQKSIKIVEPHFRDYKKLISGGLAGFSSVCVAQLLSLSTLDISLEIAVGAFAVSLPLLVKDILDIEIENFRGFRIDTDARLNALVSGWLTSVIGIVGIFYHFSPWFSFLFLLAVVWCAWKHDKYSTDLEGEVKTRTDDEPDTS